VTRPTTVTVPVRSGSLSAAAAPSPDAKPSPGPHGGQVEPSPSPMGPPKYDRNIVKKKARFRLMKKVTFRGTVSDFDDTKKLIMVVAYAVKVGVATEQVDLDIVAASVSATFTVYTNSPTGYDEIKNTVNTELNNATNFQHAMTDSLGAYAAFSGLTVEDASAPPSGVIDGQPEGLTAASDGGSVGVIVGAVLGSVFGVGLIAGGAAYVSHNRKTEPMMNKNDINSSGRTPAKGGDMVKKGEYVANAI